MDSTSLAVSYRGERVLRMRDLVQRLQLSQSRLYALIAEDKFLRPFKLIPDGRAVGWLERDVDAWLADRRLGQSVNEAGKTYFKEPTAIRGFDEDQG
jgi:predicted DNA-binding transcriptional regulator AlpA